VIVLGMVHILCRLCFASCAPALLAMAAPRICAACGMAGGHREDCRRLRSAAARERTRRAGGIRRLYDSAAWRERTQPAVLARDPLCRIAVLCGGRAPSREADHEVPAEIWIAQHGGDWREFFNEANLRGACKACHSHKTAEESRRDMGVAAAAPVSPRPLSNHARAPAAKDFSVENPAGAAGAREIGLAH
jgi:5-methylcytosine-specific restriction endonuclease McrA